MPKDCQCKMCQRACQQRPGWFKFGEAEKAAEFLGLSLKEFFNLYLAVDYHQIKRFDGENFVFALSPTLKEAKKGDMFSSIPIGTCIFYNDGKCSIHSVKPFECRSYMHGDTNKRVGDRKKAIIKTWNNQEAQKHIESLLGREPAPHSFLEIVDELLKRSIYYDAPLEGPNK